MLRARLPAGRGPHDRAARGLRLLARLRGRLLAGPTAELGRFASGDARDVESGRSSTGRRAPRRTTSGTSGASFTGGHLPAGRFRERHHARQLAADRLLARADCRRHATRSGSTTCAGPRQLEPLVALLDADRGAAAPTAATAIRGLRLRRTSSARPTVWRSTSTSARRGGSGPSSPCWSSTSASRRAANLDRGRTFPRQRRHRQLPDRPAPEHRAAQLRRRQQLPVPDPARRADPAAGREPAARRARTSASRTSPTAATACTRSSGTSARRPERWLPTASRQAGTPRAVRNTPAHLADFQRLLRRGLGVALDWPAHIRTTPM